MASNLKTVKILAIDGGGIRGIIPALILAELQKRLERHLHAVFDLIAGTSTGGIIALGIGTNCKNGTNSYLPGEMADLYINQGSKIFKKSIFHRIKKIFYPKYSPKPLEETLEEFFQDAPFSSALTPLLISSYDLISAQPFFFKSHRIANEPDRDWPVRTIARATSAAPTYFPPLKLYNKQETYCLVDGGVFANNPALAAYAEARKLYPHADSFIIVSVGSGTEPNSKENNARTKNWGLLNWAKELVPLLMNSASAAVDYEMNTIPGCHYYRFQIDKLTNYEVEMDNAKPTNLANLQRVTQEYLSLIETNTKLNQLCQLLKEGRAFNMQGTGKSHQSHAQNIS